MSSSEQWVSTAWINALRDEVLRVGRQLPEVARVVAVGVWIATFTEKDGGNAFPSRETLATLAGCSQETVTRAVKVLMGVGVLARQRRPNASPIYQLLIPYGRLDWSSHIHHMTDTRQRRARRREKERVVADAVRTASADTFRTASAYGVPDSVRVGGSGPRPRTPSAGADSVRGRPRTASADTFRTASADAPTSPIPTSGRDQPPDHIPAGLEPQPQDAPAHEAPGPAAPTLRPVPGPPGGARSRKPAAKDGSSQRPLLLPVRSPADVSPEELQALRAAATADEIHQAITELGRTQAIRVYGLRLVGPLLAALPDHDTGT
ncbi:helix-turn-helix protein [Streptomyces sp. 3212.3]|uniref:helix-turn-helix domain-containing protein n=1 Tax=Streptomyces sp. 3212.3 TaxID=1938846 RepID=UPI000E3853BD|nr:helix-turn-helix domain-containing protein [Streptomyces sp. 3212.3]REE62162.1 helix-turn-helix protein [Streptomyces sp. 3212.3]